MTIMNTRVRVLLLIGLIFVLFGSCKKFLDPIPNGDRSSDDLWKYQNMVQGLVARCYDSFTTNYNNNEGAYLDGAADNAVITSTAHVLDRLATGTLSTGLDPFLTYWSRDYTCIRQVNLFLYNRRGYNTKFLLDASLNDVLRGRLQGEAFALRAWFEWDLLQKFGGKGTDGNMLGFPIDTIPIDINGEINFARNTYDDCVKLILRDCDSAYKYLPLANRDFLYPGNPPKLAYLGGKLWGRFDGISAKALKANVYLTWASPRFNPGNIVTRWDSAASNAKKVIDFKLTVDGVQASGFNPVNAVNWFNPNFPGIVLPSRWVTASTDMEAMERMFYPGGFQGNGVMGATQELVDAFPDSLGYPISVSTVYDSDNPYAKRDPRFYSTIFYNNEQVLRKNTPAPPASNLMYTIEAWSNGGKDAAGLKSSNSKTNYYIKKFVYMGLNWNDATSSQDRQPHSKFIIRWEHMLLAFAEAANQVGGPTDTKYGMSAETAIQYLRARKTPEGTNGLSPTVGNAPDAYLASVAAAGKAAFDELVKNERRIETCFEGMRFYDIRRWTTDLTSLNQAVHGAGITQNPDLSFTYDLTTFKVEDRKYTSAYLPIPYTEMLRMSNLVQNEGWDGWN
jgi:starch-binding outer membrane protein, SusD/RagB family